MVIIDKFNKFESTDGAMFMICVNFLFVGNKNDAVLMMNK